MNKTKETKRPTHAIFQVIGDDDKARWVKIGAAWPNRDGKGFTLKFDALPGAVGHTALREITKQDAGDERNRGQR